MVRRWKEEGRRFHMEVGVESASCLEVLQPFTANIIVCQKELSELEDKSLNQFYNQFENKGYAVSISKFKCNELGVINNMSKYGNRSFDSNRLKNATYIVDMQIEIYKRSGSEMKLYNTIDFQRTLVVKNEII